MHIIKTWLDKIISWVCIVLFSSLVVTVTWQVFTRYVLKDPSVVSEELAKILFVWLALFSAALLFGEKGHMNIELVKKKAKGKNKYIIDIFCEVVILFIAAFVLLNGGIQIVSNGLSQTNAAIPWLKTGQIYMAVPISGAVIIFYNIYSIIEDVKKMTAKEKELV